VYVSKFRTCDNNQEVVANEEKAAYLKAAQLDADSPGINSNNPLPRLHAAAVYERSLCHILEVLGLRHYY